MTEWNNATIRELEHASIRAFTQQAADLGHLAGRVLDYGCGKQPYRDIVEQAGGEYHAFDRISFPANVSGEDIGDSDALEQAWDAILCTQVIQYEPDSFRLLYDFHTILAYSGGVLVISWPLCWDEIEPEDLWRFTRTGMERLLRDAGFHIELCERRAAVELGGFRFPLGYGAVARA